VRRGDGYHRVPCYVRIEARTRTRVSVTLTGRDGVVARVNRTIDPKSPLRVRLSPEVKRGSYALTISYTADGITRTSRRTVRIS
jgi:hypothetical protein